MSFLRHEQIYRSDLFLPNRSEAFSGFAPAFIVSMSLRPAIPRRVALLQSPLPLHWPASVFHSPAKSVNHHLARAGEFSTGTLGNFRPELTVVRVADQPLPDCHANRPGRSIGGAFAAPLTKHSPCAAGSQVRGKLLFFRWGGYRLHWLISGSSPLVGASSRI